MPRCAPRDCPRAADCVGIPDSSGRLANSINHRPAPPPRRKQCWHINCVNHSQVAESGVIRRGIATIVAVAGGLGLASPALARGWLEVPEPSDMTLFALGVTGLIVGRYAARRKPRK